MGWWNLISNTPVQRWVRKYKVILRKCFVHAAHAIRHKTYVLKKPMLLRAIL
jgi:hypothetical protein